MASLQTYLRATLEGLTRATLALAVRSARVSRSGLRLRAVRAKLSRTCGGGNSSNSAAFPEEEKGTMNSKVKRHI